MAERDASAPDRKAQGGGRGGRVGAMAAKTAGGGRWEVVKKGRRPGAGGSGKGGGGDRRALGEANGVWKYDLTREYPPACRPRRRPAPGLPARWLVESSYRSPEAQNSPGLLAERALLPIGTYQFSRRYLALSLLSLTRGRQREGGRCPRLSDA